VRSFNQKELTQMVEIVKPIVQLAPSYLEFIEEMRLNGEKIWEGRIPREGESLEKFVARLNREEVSPGPALVPQSSYWGVTEDGQVVGRIAIRHYLNEKLREFGGHIGYEVRPSCRRRGVAKEMLKKVLATPRAQEIGRLLVTCDPSNEASNKTILANGGVLERTAYVAAWDRETNYYWIDSGKTR
jgi:predicted acetyltransferase